MRGFSLFGSFILRHSKKVLTRTDKVEKRRLCSGFKNNQYFQLNIHISTSSRAEQQNIMSTEDICKEFVYILMNIVCGSYQRLNIIYTLITHLVNIVI